MKLRFLGSGNATSIINGESSAVLEVNHQHLCIDFGKDAYHRFKNEYQKVPDAIYITHCHLDHIAGIESLFYDICINQAPAPKLFLSYHIIPLFVQRMHLGCSPLAEGGTNFFDMFQIIPVIDKFYFSGIHFEIFEARHHQPQFCFGLHCPGHFLFTGDTKPIPEVLNYRCRHNEIIFHDLSTAEQPSHTSVSELNQYPKELLSSKWFYHLADFAAESQIHPLQIVKKDMVFDFGPVKTNGNNALPSTVEPHFPLTSVTSN